MNDEARANRLKSGSFEEAERLVREGVRFLEPTQFLNDRGFALLDVAEVLRMARRNDEAVPPLEQALELFERKGNVVSAERARRILEEIRAS